MAEATKKVRFLQGVILDAERSAKEREVVEVPIPFGNWVVFVGQAEDVDQDTALGLPAVVQNQDPKPQNQDPKVKR